jgi:hypothetical protein
MTINGSKHERILNYIELIQRKPNKDAKFFHFDEGKKCIIDGSKLKLLPFNLHYLYTKDEFYVHINPTDKRVMYYAYDIQNCVGEKKTNEEEGFMEWQDIEDCIYNFFVMNIRALSEVVSPYTDAYEPIRPTYTPPTTTQTNTYPGYAGREYTGNNYSSYNSPFSYGTPEYKAREAFYDKLNALIKESRTSIAIDLISSHIGKLCDEKKFEELDVLLRSMTFDKLNIPTMIEVLNATSDSDKSLKARKEFFEKVKTHITKIKPSRADNILKGLRSV